MMDERREMEPLAQQWGKRLHAARKHWEKFHKRCAHNRKVAAGFDWGKNPDADDFYVPRANLIHGTITAMLPNIYARNPEISATPIYKADHLRGVCDTLESVVNRQFETANLKAKAKATVRSAMVTSFGAVKVMYQRDMVTDPVIQSRINDTQDNIATAQQLIDACDDPQQRGDLEVKRAELEQVMAALSEQSEVVAAEGLVVDRVLPDHLLIDPTVIEFWDYKSADWIAQIVPMKKARAEATYGVKLEGAKSYRESQDVRHDGRLASLSNDSAEDCQIAVIEIWDRESQRVYTLAEGCDFWLRKPYSPERVGERWFPFFLLPFQVVDGQFIGPSVVDLVEKLQAEHNEARDKFNQHRRLCLPGWVASSDVTEKSLKRFTDATLGEITIIDTEGKPLVQVFAPKQHPPIDPAVYDTSQVRYDWEQVTGLQDAARSTVVREKTATEASILQQALSGRVGEFRDQVEDWLQEIAQYAAQILLMELTIEQVRRIAGSEADWPVLSRDEVFGLVEMRIRAGTTGAPDRAEQQEAWGKVLPVIQSIVQPIMQMAAAGTDFQPLANLVRETIKRFDERLDAEMFLPQPMPQQGLPMQPSPISMTGVM